MQVSRSAVPLEAFAESAGRTLACMFTSSDEYEAALIAERRAEGRYQTGYGRRLAFVCGIGAAILIMAFFFVA